MTHLVGMPTWFEDWTREGDGIDLTGFQWIHSRPAPVQQLLMKFPPGCVVRVLKPCICTADTTDTADCVECGGSGRLQDYVGVVYSILGGDTDSPTIKVTKTPRDASNATEHDLANLEVIGYWNGITPEVVQGVLEMKPVLQLMRGEKIGRNAPCPCGSTKKYKHCCAAPRSDQQEALQ